MTISSMALADAKVIYLTRHAEKARNADDPSLTAEGEKRAQNIAAMLQKANISRIYSTKFARTEQTAKPFSAAAKLPVQTYDGKQLATFAAQLKKLTGRTLVVGHSDTTPALVALLGGDPGEPIADNEYDRLYQVVIGSDGEVTTTLFTSTAKP